MVGLLDIVTDKDQAADLRHNKGGWGTFFVFLLLYPRSSFGVCEPFCELSQVSNVDDNVSNCRILLPRLRVRGSRFDGPSRLTDGHLH